MTEKHFSDADKAKAARRELALRKAVYPKRVNDRRMSAEGAAREIMIMEEIARDYEERVAEAHAATSELDDP